MCLLGTGLVSIQPGFPETEAVFCELTSKEALSQRLLLWSLAPCRLFTL